MVGDRLSEDELLSQLPRADATRRRQLADELFSIYYERVGRWCFRFTQDRERAADIAQEVFAKAYAHLSSFQGKAKFSTWLYTIARNECMNALKAKKPELLAQDEDFLPQLMDPSKSVRDRLESAQAADSVRALLRESLDETERVVFTLHYAEDLPLDTITRVLHLGNASGAKAYIVSAKRKLGRAVERWKARGEI